uniref:Uncharacterized protein n=1 Tax=Tetradesmus obliquus TaxID=3088 RepID=A0A383VT93_TETOB|eukprot:jgi/Sobl393_1/1975/SZX67616.1
MVYWGCGTTRNRCMWATFATSALLGSLLLIAGGAKLDICSKLPLKVHVAAGACSAGPVAMMVIGAFVLLGTIPSLLFFSGCAKGPLQTRYGEGVQASGITVVRRTADGPQLFHYDSHGRLIAAPDCTKQSAKSSQFVLKGIKTGVKAAPALPGSTCSSNSGTPRHPLLAGNRVRLFSSETGEAATGEVFVCAVMPQQQQQQQDVGPLAAGRMLAVHHHQERELQQQLEQHRQRQQQLEMQQQQQSEQQEADQQHPAHLQQH